MRGKTIVQSMEELHVQPKAGCTYEADYNAVGTEGIHQGTWTDRILEPSGHVLSGVTAVPAHILLGVPARRPEAQTGATVPCGGVHQGVGGQTDSRTAAMQVGSGPERVQAGQDQSTERSVVVGQQRLREPVAAQTQDTVVHRFAQL